MFLESGDLAANPGVAARALEGSKAAGDFDADLHHAEGALGFVVGEGQFQSPEEG